MDTDLERVKMLSEHELREAIQRAKDARDALPYGDPRWYEAQYQIYALNQDLSWLLKAKRRK